MSTKRKVKRYTEEEDAIILESISQYPSNFDVAFEQAAMQLKGRTRLGVTQRWYSYLKNKANPTMAIATRSGMMINAKIMRRPSEMKSMGISAFEVAAEAISSGTMTSDEMMALVRMMWTKKKVR